MRERIGDMQYGVILADPPWPYKCWAGEGKTQYGVAESHYPIMAVEDIQALPVGNLALLDSALFLWTTWPLLPVALEVGQGWGFGYKTLAFLWAKLNPSGIGFFMGLGHWTRANSEPCLLFTRGSISAQVNDVLQLIITPRREHSRKPDEQYHRIERLLPGPYLELFARRKREGWHAWGNEVVSDIELI